MALQNFKDVIQAFDGPKRHQLEKDYQVLVNTFIKDHLQSKKATIKEFTKYLDKINIYAHRDLGVMLIIPDDLSGVIKMSNDSNLQDVVLKLIEQTNKLIDHNNKLTEQNNKLIEQNSLIIQINAEQSAQLSEVLLMLEDSEPAQRSGSLDG